jgi:hypothetical protein
VRAYKQHQYDGQTTTEVAVVLLIIVMLFSEVHDILNNLFLECIMKHKRSLNAYLHLGFLNIITLNLKFSVLLGHKLLDLSCVNQLQTWWKCEVMLINKICAWRFISELYGME